MNSLMVNPEIIDTLNRILDHAKDSLQEQADKHSGNRYGAWLEDQIVYLGKLNSTEHPVCVMSFLIGYYEMVEDSREVEKIRTQLHTVEEMIGDA